MPTFYSTRQVAEILHQPLWHIQRLYEDGNLPEPARFVGKRVIAAAELPAVVAALEARGWLARDGEGKHAS